MHHLFKNIKSEKALETPILAEVINSKSNDYLQTFYFTHKCTDGANVTWYKAHAEYIVENTTSLWFKEAEVSWLEQVE